MYDKFEGFVKDLEGVGKTLRQSQNSYEDAMKKLTSGNGNLTVTAEKIKKLGAKASKQIDQKFIDEESLN
jgi:DNA recombination protein RmuC